jgi:phosphoglycerate dehydrogenase-like enzyme
MSAGVRATAGGRTCENHAVQPLIAVTAPELARGAAVFARTADARIVEAPPDEAGLAAAITASGARHAIVGHSPYRGPLYEALPRGAVLARFGVGHDGIDKRAATAAGLLCTNTPGVLDQSVAETTIALMLAAARHVPAMAASTAAGRWEPREGIELMGKTLAVVGTGRIGCAVARIAARGFGMRVVGCGRRPRDGQDFAAAGLEYEQAVDGADFVSLHIPARAENLKFLDAAKIARLAPHAWLINTARGAVVDEAALYDALEAGRLAGAALDVFEHEPYVPVDPERDFRRLSNVVLLPHVGSNTADANRGMASRSLQNVLLGDRGAFDQMDLLNPEVLQSLTR